MPVQTSPYPTVEQVLNVARAALADAGTDPISGLIVGDVLTDSRPGTFVHVQAAYEWLQAELENNGVTTFCKTTTLVGLPPVATQDPGINIFIGFNGNNDGVTNHATPALPSDMKIPLWMQQRQSGTQNRFVPDPPQTSSNDGLPSRVKTTYSVEWEWSTDQINMVGAILSLDLLIRYRVRLPVLTIGTQQVLIADSLNPLGYMTAGMYSQSVGGAGAEGMIEQAKMLCDQIITQTTQQQQRGNHRRMGYAAWRHRGWGSSW
jgi:hypothetical protein